MKTLQISSKNLGILFDESHFLPVSREGLDPITFNLNVGSLDVLKSFLLSKYQNVPSPKEQKDNVTVDKITYGPKLDADDGNNSKKEWKAFTKSMQVIVISPSVRKAVDTIKALKDIRVRHSFVHKKQTLKMTEEQWLQHQAAQQDELTVIPLRICELFGKHRKIDYQQRELRNKSWHIGVGGINRIRKLTETKHLNLAQCDLIIIDLQQNVKHQSILQMPPMAKDLCEWFKAYAFKRILAGKLKVAVF